MSGKKQHSKDELLKTRIESLQADDGVGLILNALETHQNGDGGPTAGLQSTRTFHVSQQSRSYTAPEGFKVEDQAPPKPEEKKAASRFPNAPSVVLPKPPVPPSSAASMNEKTIVAYGADPVLPNAPMDQGYSNTADKTIVVGQAPSVADAKPIYGVAKPSTRMPTSEHAAAVEAQLNMAENLHLAQGRFNELEAEIERLRLENENLHSLSVQYSDKINDMTGQLQRMEKMNAESFEMYSSEMNMSKQNLQEREAQVSRLQAKVEELNSRLGQDLRKIRLRERELENRLELAKLEKDALLRAKDEAILESKRRLDACEIELDSYKNRVLELNKILGTNNEQLTRTVRALRLALSNLEADPNAGNGAVSRPSPLVPLKKAE